MRSAIAETGSYRISTIFFIALLCYTPIFGKIIPATNFGAGIPDLDPLRILAYILILAFITEFSMVGGSKAWHPWLAIVFAFVFVVCISPIWSPVYGYDSVTSQELFNNVLLPALVAVIAISLFKNEGVVRKYCQHIMIASIVLSVICLVQFVQGSSIINEQARSMATFNNPNLLAVYLVLSQAVVLFATDTGRIPKRIGQLAQILLVLAMFTTVSRKGLTTMVVAFALYYFFTKQYRKIVFGFIILVFLAIGASGFSQISSRFGEGMLTHQVEGKANLAMAGVRMFMDKPFLGHGYRGYYQNFGVYLPQFNRDHYDAHNEYATALANYGLVGFPLFLLIFLYPLFWAKKRLKIIPPPLMRDQRLRVLVGFLSVVTFMMSQFYAGFLFYSNLAVILLYSNIALMLSTSLVFNEEKENDTSGEEVATSTARYKILRYRTREHKNV